MPIPYSGAVNKTMSLSVEAIAKLRQLAAELKISQGEVARQGIDLIWAKYHPDDEVEIYFDEVESA